MNPEQHERGMDAARQVSRWQLGDPYWATLLINAYNNPDRALEELAKEKA